MTSPHTIQHEVVTVVSDTPATADQDCLHRLAQGDTTAFWEIWEHYREPVLARRCLHWMGGDQAAADDALSSACLKAWKKLPVYAHGISNVKGWLLQLLHHHCMDIRRAYRRGRTPVEHTSEDITVAVEEVRQAPASPEDAVLQQEMHVAIRQALLRLPTRLRAPAILRFYHELPHRDIAQRLSLTLETVRKRIQQARVLLQEQLRGYLDGTHGPDWGDNEPVASVPTCWHIDAPAA